MRSEVHYKGGTRLFQYRLANRRFAIRLLIWNEKVGPFFMTRTVVEDKANSKGQKKMAQVRGQTASLYLKSFERSLNFNFCKNRFLIISY